jgi:hypothetical protein
MDDDAICSLVKRLSRPDGAGGAVIERAAIMAEGSDAALILAWIAANGGKPEPAAPASSRQGLHATRLGGGGGEAAGPPRRYVVPRSSLP